MLDDSAISAIRAYDLSLVGKPVVKENVPLDALVFAEWQTPYTSFDVYKEKRCHFDPETNEWLEDYIRLMAMNADRLPRIIVQYTKTGIALIDGLHRVSALLIHTDRTFVSALVFA